VNRAAIKASQILFARKVNVTDTFALLIFRLHKLGIEAHVYAHYTSLLCFAFDKTNMLELGGLPEKATAHPAGHPYVIDAKNQ